MGTVKNFSKYYKIYNLRYTVLSLTKILVISTVFSREKIVLLNLLSLENSYKELSKALLVFIPILSDDSRKCPGSDLFMIQN